MHPTMMQPHLATTETCNIAIAVMSADYKDHVNPGIANSFAAAAMRFGHSQLEGLLRSRDSNYVVSRTMPLSTVLSGV